MFKTFQKVQRIKVIQYSSVLLGICAFLIHFVWNLYIMCPVFVWLISGDVR